MAQKKYLPYFTLFFFFVNSAFAQDRLVKKDSTLLNVKIIEINTTQVKYILQNNPDGPIHTELKSEFVRAEYSNGSMDYFKNSPLKTEVESMPTIASKKNVSTDKIGNWIKFNIDFGVTYYKSFVAIPLRLNQSEHRYGNGTIYTNNGDSYKNRLSPTLSINLLFGKANVKHIVGLSYLNVKTNYNQSTVEGATGGNYPETPGPFYSSYTNVSVSAFYHIAALNTGLNIKIHKGLSASILASVGYALPGKMTSNGYRVDGTTIHNPSGPGFISTNETTLIENEKSNTNSIAFFSGQARINYDFKIKENICGIYLLGNFSIYNRLPYCAIGFTLFPFKNLREASN